MGSNTRILLHAYIPYAVMFRHKFLIFLIVRPGVGISQKKMSCAVPSGLKKKIELRSAVLSSSSIKMNCAALCLPAQTEKWTALGCAVQVKN